MASKLNKYHSSGRHYSRFDPRAQSQERYLIRGYIHPVGSFQNYAENRIRPYNLGIKKANKQAEMLGHRFNKAQYINYMS